MVTIINCSKIVGKTQFCYFPAACVSSGQSAVTDPVKEEILIKSTTHGGLGVVVSTLGVADWNCNIGVVFTV